MLQSYDAIGILHLVDRSQTSEEFVRQLLPQLAGGPLDAVIRNWQQSDAPMLAVLEHPPYVTAVVIPQASDMKLVFAQLASEYYAATRNGEMVPVAAHTFDAQVAGEAHLRWREALIGAARVGLEIGEHLTTSTDETVAQMRAAQDALALGRVEDRRMRMH